MLKRIAGFFIAISMFATLGMAQIRYPFYINLGDLLDVAGTATTAPTDNYVLTYDAATKLWGPEAAGAGSIDTSGTPVANDFARFTDADTLEGRSVAEVLADLSLEEADIEGMIDTLGAITFTGDLTTDRWLGSINNTFVGIDTAGAGNLAHEAESEGWYNTAFGYGTLREVITGSSNTAIGRAALRSTTTGSRNSAIGLNAGRYQNDGTSAFETPENSVYLGALAKSGSDPDGGEDAITNEIVIGYNATGGGSNTFTLGNTSVANVITSGSITLGSVIGPAAALDINTATIQDVNFWDTIASGNPSINIYGWNTAGSDLESAELSMDDTNDEFIIQVPNSANNEGVTVSLQETNQRFRLRQNSDVFSIRMDGSDALFHTTDGQFTFTTDEGAAATALWLYDADDTHYAGIDVPAAVTGSWLLTIPAAVPGAASVLEVDTSGDATWTAVAGLGGGAANVTDITNGAQVLGTGPAILTLNDGTYTTSLRTTQAEGLSYGDFRILMDEQSNNMLPIIIAGTAEATQDMALAATTHPQIFLSDGDTAGGTLYAYDEIVASGNFIYAAGTTSWVNFQAENFTIQGSNDVDVGDFATIKAGSPNIELIDTDGQQSMLEVQARASQSGTAAFDGILVDTIEEAFGDGTTGDGNNLFRAASLGTTAFQVQIPNSSLTYVHSSTLFDAAATTDSVTICTIPANSIIWSISMELETQFVADSLTDVDITIGDGTDVDGFMVKAMNLVSDGVNTNYATRGDLWNTKQQGGFYYVASSETIVATATATGANFSTTSAGQVRFTVAYMCLDEQ